MTIMTTGFIPCGAKMPIIALFAGALFGGSAAAVLHPAEAPFREAEVAEKPKDDGGQEDDGSRPLNKGPPSSGR